MGQSSSGQSLAVTTSATSSPEVINGTLSSLNYPFTVSFWMKLNYNSNVTYYPILNTHVSTTGYSGVVVGYNPASNSIAVVCGDNGGFGSQYRRSILGFAPNIYGQWVHVSVVITNATTGAIYLNGSPLTISTTGTGAMNFNHPATGTSAIGYNLGSQGGYYLDGQVDELRVWTRLLSQSEIRENMCRKLQGSEPGLMAYYKFDGTGTTVADHTGGGNDMTYTSGAGTSTIISRAPIGDTSAYTYNAGTVSLSIPSGVTLSAVNGTGGTDGVHLYYCGSHPDQDQGIGALCDTIGHFGRFIATNPAQPNIPGKITIQPAMSTLYTRAASNDGVWNTAPASSTMYYSDIFREFIFDPGQFLAIDIGDIPICDSATISVPNVIGATYTWSTGQSGRAIGNPGPGEHWVTISTNCSVQTDTFTVFRDTITEPFALPDSAFVCNGDTIVIAVFPYANRPPIDTVVWTDGYYTVDRPVTQPGWYYAYTGVSGSCWQYDSIYVASVAGNFSFGADQIICAGEDVVLDVPPGAAGIVWSTGATDDQSITVASTGTYWVEFELNSCVLSDTIEVEKKRVNVQINGILSICEGETSVLSFLTSSDPDMIMWSTGETTDFISVDQPGTYWVQIFADGCVAGDTIAFEVLEGVRRVPVQNEVLCEEESVLLTLTGVVPDTYINDIVWSNGETGDSVTVNLPGRYTAEGLSPCGPYTVEFFVEEVSCQPIMFIPSAFSPNGDGLNDRFEIAVRGAREFRMNIFDRWGNQVFETFNPEVFWEGKEVPEGTYVYRIIGTTYLNRSFEKQGSVLIVH